MKALKCLSLGLLAIFGAVSASLLAVETTYYFNDPLATTIGTSDAAGEIAAMEADAFGAPIAAGHAPSRYTGKPYDEDLGAYVFPFRNYRAQEARWMSADPSGFPDGVNGRSYLGRPLSYVDGYGLSGWELIDDSRPEAPLNMFIDRPYEILFDNFYINSSTLWDIEQTGWTTLNLTPQEFPKNGQVTAGVAFQTTETLSTTVGEGFTVGYSYSLSTQTSTSLTLNPVEGYEKFRVTWYVQAIRFAKVNADISYVNGQMIYNENMRSSWTSAYTANIFYKFEGYKE